MRRVGVDGLDLLALDSRDVASWRLRIERDRRCARAHQAADGRHATELLTARSIASGAQAVALTGSTVRRRRTAASDLDLHVVGTRPPLDDIEVDVDVYATTADELFTRLRDGDDYTQWTLRFGWVLFDTGILREAAAELAASGRWPSPERKLGQVHRMLRVTEQVLASGDVDAAAEQVKGALTGTARWRLLEAGVFPLSRAELPGQLRAIGERAIASALDRCIDGDPDEDELLAFSGVVRAATSGANALTATSVR